MRASTLILGQSTVTKRYNARHTCVGLDWISKELHMGVRSSVSRAERELTSRLDKDKELCEMWKKLNMRQISSWNLFLEAGIEWNMESGESILSTPK